MTKAEFMEKFSKLDNAQRKQLETYYNDLLKGAVFLDTFTEAEMRLMWINEATEKLAYIKDIREEKHRKIREVMSGLYTDDIVNAWNNYIAEVNLTDDEVFPMDDFSENMQWRPALDVVIDCMLGEFDYNDYYYWIDLSTNITSFSHWDDDDSPIDMEAMIDFMVEKSNALKVKGVEAILNGGE